MLALFADCAEVQGRKNCARDADNPSAIVTSCYTSKAWSATFRIDMTFAVQCSAVIMRWVLDGFGLDPPLSLLQTSLAVYEENISCLVVSWSRFAWQLQCFAGSFEERWIHYSSRFQWSSHDPVVSLMFGANQLQWRAPAGWRRAGGFLSRWWVS